MPLGLYIVQIASLDGRREVEMNNQALQRRLYNSRLASHYLGICERKLWELSNSGSLKTVRIGRSVRFDIADLDSFIMQMKGVTE